MNEVERSIQELRRRSSVKWRWHAPDVLPAFIAEMDFPLAEPVAAALRDAVARGDTGYAWPGELQQAFAEYAEREQGWRPAPDSVRTCGGVVTALRVVVERLTDPGGRVVVSSPIYPPFLTMPRALAREVVEVPLGRDGDGYVLDLDALAAAFARPGRCVYLLCSPHNPTGLVMGPDTLRDVAALARRFGVTVVSDEVHGPLTSPGTTFTAYGAVDADLGADLVVTAASKAWNFPGLNCAIVAPAAPGGAAAVGRLPPDMVFGTGHFGVVASVAAYRDGGPWLTEVRRTVAANAELLDDLIAEHLPDVRYVPPQGTYLAWLDCRGLGLGDDPATVFLRKGRVALSPGLDFGLGGAGHARLNLGTYPWLVEEAVRRMAAATGEPRP